MARQNFKDIGEVTSALQKCAKDLAGSKDAANTATLAMLVDAMLKMAGDMENCQSQMSDCHARMADCQTRMNDCENRMADCQQQMADCQKQMQK